MRFATRSAWMQHEYTFHRQHFEWRCVDRTCPAFLSESEFLAHLVDSHKISNFKAPELLLIANDRRRLAPTYTDAKIECPICLHSVPNQRVKIGRHLGRHMEDIALPILSIAVATDELTNSAGTGDEESSSNNGNPVMYPHLANDDHTSDQLPCGDESVTFSRTPKIRRRKIRQTSPSQGDSVLISYLDPNRLDITEEVLSHALKSASVSEVEEEDLSHALKSASVSEVEEEDDRTNFDSGSQRPFDRTNLDSGYQIQRAPNRGDVEASHPLANADTPSLHELSGLSYTSSQGVGTSPAPSTPPATSPTRKKKHREVHKDPYPDAPDDEALKMRKCPYCKQTFSGAVGNQISNLKRHIRHKHRHPGQAPPYVCPKCGKGFDRSDYLSSHEKKC